MSDRKYISKVISNGETYHVKDKEIRDSLGQVNGIATLGSDGKVSPSQLPTDIDTTYQFSQSGNSLQVGVNGGAKDTVYTPTITKSTVGLDNVTNDAQVKRTEMGAASGVATLDDNGKVPASQLPSYVDDVLEYADRSSFPQTGETGKIYVDKSTNITWRWGGSDYVEISPSLALGETSSTAYAGDKGKALADKLSGIESGAQVHRAPTTAEVKSALGTGSGTVKYLREDGTWATPPNSQYSFVDKDATLDWGTRSTIATAGDVDIHVTMPSNPNTNTARLQVSDTANKRINTKESTGNYLQFIGGTNKFSVSDGTNTFDVGITPSVSFPVTSVVGQTGGVTVSQIASALTDAGYKLTDTIYSLPAAASNTLGGIKTGYTTDARNYKVSLDSNSNAYVNVPWSDTTYSAGTGISLSGTTFGINSTYQDYISHGNTAYSWGNHANAGYASASSLGNYLPLNAGASYPLTGDLYISPYERIAIIQGTALTGYDFSALTGAISFSIVTNRTDNDPSAFILNGDTAIIYNAFDTGWGFQVHDEDLANAQSNVFNDNTRTFGVTDGYNVWARGGFVKNGSDNTHVLLGGGGHAAISELYVNYANTAGSAPASDVYAWAKAATKPSYTHNEIDAGDLTIGNGANRIYLRTDPAWATAIYHHTTADEAVVFLNNGLNVSGNTDYTTSWIFAYGNPYDRPAWNTLTPSLQIKGQCVAINKLIVSQAGGSYNLDVNGSANATTLYENGSRVITTANIGSQSVNYATNATNATYATYDGNGANISSTYLKLSGGTMTGKITSPSNSTDNEYGGALEIREYNYVALDQSDWNYAPRISFHWGGRAVGSFGLRSDGLIAWANQPLIHSGNIGNQSVNYANSAGSVAWGNVSGKPSEFTPSSGSSYYLEELPWWVSGESHDVDNLNNGITFAYVDHNAPTTGTIVAMNARDVSGYCLQLQGSYSSNNLFFRNRNGDNNTWNPWREVVHSGNIGSQSVNYANSAGSVEWSNVSGRPTNVSSFTNDSGYITSSGNCASAGGLNYKSIVYSLDALDAAHWTNQLNAYIFSEFNTSILSGNGIIIDGGYTSTNYGFQILIDDDPSYIMGLRQRNGDGWAPWKRIPMGDGTGASGTWGINITGSAGSVAWDNVSGRPSSMPASDVYSWAKASSKPSYSWSEISDKPTSMPASDVYSWAKASSKPSYSWSEITNKPTIPSAGEINYYSYSATIDPSYGLNVLVKISSSGGSIYLPTLSSCQTYTGTSGSQKFALIIRVACHTGGQNFTLYGYRGTGYSQYPHVRSGSTADRTSGVGFGAGDTDTYMLTYDGSLYEAYRLCYTE